MRDRVVVVCKERTQVITNNTKITRKKKERLCSSCYSHFPPRCLKLTNQISFKSANPIKVLQDRISIICDWRLQPVRIQIDRQLRDICPVCKLYTSRVQATLQSCRWTPYYVVRCKSRLLSCCVILTVYHSNSDLIEWNGPGYHIYWYW